MILQSHNGETHLLPAIPAAWGQGSVSGLRARGGFTIDLAWKNGALTEVKITSRSGTEAQVRYDGKVIGLTFSRGEQKTLKFSDF